VFCGTEPEVEDEDPFWATAITAQAQDSPPTASALELDKHASQ